jgi:PHP family Zn ribbon phosphoesterase
MLREIRADLHVHTCLSPCGNLAMVPGVIAEAAAMKRLNVLGICDHNATENVQAVKAAAGRKGIAVLGGMEITSEEEVHILALFDDEEKLAELQEIVYANLPGVNDESVFGEQAIVNESDRVVDRSERFLIGATTISLERIVEMIRSLCGLAIASHVDRESFGLIGQLGFIPEGLPLDAVEVAPRIGWANGRTVPSTISGFPVVTFSDAHYPEDVGSRWTTFRAEDVRVEEMRMALLGRGGRSVSLTA